MSAYIITQEHLEEILKGYQKACAVARRDAPDLDRIGLVLWRENARSVAYRYEEAEDKCWEGYEFKNKTASTLHPLAVYRLVDSLEYQSCEHEGWERSEANKLCRQIKDVLVASTKEYQAARWSV